MRPRCLITGCELVAQNMMGATAHGDLHRLGDSYVFNAVRDESGETNWKHEAPRSDRIIFVDTATVFERRGVIVVAIEDARLSDSARNFIESAP